MTRFQKYLHWTIGVAALAVAVCGAVLRLTVRDRFHSLSTIFYATPPVVIASLLVVAAWCLWRLRRGRTAVVLLVAATVCMNWWQQTAWFGSGQALTPPSAAVDHEPLRVVFWNTCRGAAGWNAVADRLAATDAEIIGTVEAGEPSPELNTLWKRHLPDYQVVSPGTGIRLASRYPIELLRHDRLAWGGDYAVFLVETPQGPLHVFIADVTTNMAVPRGVPLNHVLHVREQLDLAPLVVMGDMNTTSDSVFFDEWRKSLRNVFEECGRGCSATWPVPFPVLTLDQVWISEDVEAISCRHLSTPFSDHRIVENQLRLTVAPQ